MHIPNLRRRLAAEFIGTAMLLATVAGSGIMAERLAGGNIAVALLANVIATAAALVALILAFGGVSGAHFNPVVSMSAAIARKLPWVDAVLFALTQIAGAIFGVGIANLMFELPIFFISAKARTGTGVWLGEFVATFGLIAVIITVSRRHDLRTVALAVAAYIMAACWFTSSTSFANPAVTIARMLSDTFAGIRPVDAPAFVLAQVLGGVTAAFLFGWLVPIYKDER